MPSLDREKRRAAWRRWYERQGGKNPERSNPFADVAVRTRAEVAAALGVSIETVRLDEKSAIAKLRRSGLGQQWLELFETRASGDGGTSPLHSSYATRLNMQRDE